MFDAAHNSQDEDDGDEEEEVDDAAARDGAPVRHADSAGAGV